MTLDEAIAHCEEVADYDCYNENQMKCANEHRQLAEWLRDYKELKMQLSNKDATSDLISRQAAIDAVKELCLHYTPTKSVRHPHINFVVEELERLPSAQPEIIRCKDCKRYGQDNCFVKIQMLWELKPDDFCSQAERREE